MRMLAPLLLLLVLTASGPPRCVETETYLGDAESSDATERLIGEWYGGEGLIVRIRREPEDAPGLLRVNFVMIIGSGKNPVYFANYNAWYTALDGYEYLNLEKTSDHWPGQAPAPQRTIVRIAAVKDASVRLRLGDKEALAEGGADFWLLDGKKVAEAIRAGELKGRIEGEESDPLVTITATREALRAYLAAKGPGHVFRQEPLRMLRMPRMK